MEDKEVKQLVNECFAKRGVPKVKNFASEFADGSKYSRPLKLYISKYCLLMESDFKFRNICSSILNLLQYPLRRKGELQTSPVSSRRRQNAKLESYQRCYLLQLSVARVLSRDSNDEDAGYW